MKHAVTRSLKKVIPSSNLMKYDVVHLRMAYKHLFFDLDHTLWDFETNSKEVLRELFSLHQLDVHITNDFEEFYKVYSFHNKRLWDRYHHGFITQDDLKWKRMWHALLEFKIGDEKLSKELSAKYLELLPQQKALFPYTIEILEYLVNKNYKLHLITNGFQKTQMAKITNAGIEKYFIEVITSESANSLKPKKEIFDFAILQCETQCCDSIMLGDNLDADIRGAMNAGMDTVFVNHLREETDLKPTYTVYHLKELEQIF
jgi:putative hydrolase of the HAD superfamily